MAHFMCYVRQRHEPMASITVPFVGPCKDHTDADALAERDRVEQLHEAKTAS